jgi:hypothetical protein
VPVVYAYLDDLAQRVGRWWTRKTPVYAHADEQVSEVVE